MTVGVRGLLALGWIGAWALTGCGGGPAEPPLPDLELVVAGGDGQYGTPGQRLDAPLRVLVRRLDTGAPRSGVAVLWTVESGDASVVGGGVGTSDDQGLVEATLELGSTAGPVTVRARARDQETAQVSFQAFVVDRPELRALEPRTARGGDTITLSGVGFSPDAGQNVVLFSGIRGRVVEAVADRLSVEVPACLPAGSVAVTAQLGALVSDALALSVTDGGETPDLASGEPVDLDDDGGYACIRLAGGKRYLVTVQSAGTVGGARYGYTLRGVSSSSSAAARVPAPAAGPGRTEATPDAPMGVAEAFEARLRRREEALAREGTGPPVAGPARVVTVPTVGDERSFKVLNKDGAFDDVTAVVRLVSEGTVLYVDQTAPGGGFTSSELEAYAHTFDEFIYPVEAAAFGEPSDLDGNERVAILFTPTVNRLTDRGADGFVGGFFYGLDLQPEKEGSNGGEIFYALVPDSAGQFSDARSRELVLKVTPAILAHEFQHMIHFNQRILELGADGTEALWLSEGLAQMAEELVARELLERGTTGQAEAYRAGNRTRARRYLAATHEVSLIVATGQGTLAERGAGWLHVLHLWDRGGGDEILRRLTRTTLTGTSNVAAVMDEPWREVFADWAAALYADGLGGYRYPFDYPSLQLRDLLRTASNYPLTPEEVGPSDFTRQGSLWSSSVRHYIVVPPASGFVALRLGGEVGGGAPADAALRLRVVPLF